MKTKNGVIQYMGVVMGLATSVIGIAVVAIVLGAFGSTQTAGSLPYNITIAGLNLISGIVSQFQTIGTVTGVLLLAAVVAMFGFGGWYAYQKMQ